MIKGLIITHGDLGKELVSVAETILEEKVNIDTFSIDWEEDGSEIMNNLERYLNQHKEHKLFIFTDMFGGSPTNICLKYKRPDIEIITGVNLPGLLKFISYRDKDLDFQELARIVKKGSIDGVNLISEYLGVKKNDQRNR